MHRLFRSTPLVFACFTFALSLFAVGFSRGEETLPADLSTAKAGTDWPEFLGVDRNSVSTEKGVLTDWKAGKQPKILWKRKLGVSYGIGSVSRGRYFQYDRIGDDSVLFCLNAETGKEIWKFSHPTQYTDLYGYNGGPRCSPIIDGARVYIYGVGGWLHCLQIADGKLVWKKNLNDEFGVVQNFFGVGSSPIISGNLLLVMVGGSPASSSELPPGALGRVESNGSGVVAFEKMTGKVKYRVGEELASYASLKTAEINGRSWCFAYARGGLLAFNPATGKKDFNYPWRARILESVNAMTPVVKGDEVFISETYGPGSSLLKVKPGGYDVVWKDDDRSRDKAMQTHWMTPILVDGYLYGSSGRHTHNAELRCIEWKTGKVVWSEPDMTRCSLLLVDGHFICLSERGQIWVIKPNPEKLEVVAETLYQDELGEPLLNYPAWAAPIVSHGLMYIRGNDHLLCLDLRKTK